MFRTIVSGWPVASGNATRFGNGRTFKSDEFETWRESCIYQLQRRIADLGYDITVTAKKTKKGYTYQCETPIFASAVSVRFILYRPERIIRYHGNGPYAGQPMRKRTGEYITEPWQGDLTGVEKGLNDFLQATGVLRDDQIVKHFELDEDTRYHALGEEPYIAIEVSYHAGPPERPEWIDEFRGELGMPSVLSVSEWIHDRTAAAGLDTERGPKRSDVHCGSCTCWIGPNHEEEEIYWLQIAYLRRGPKDNVEYFEERVARWRKAHKDQVAFVCQHCAQQFFHLGNEHRVLSRTELLTMSSAEVLSHLAQIRVEIAERIDCERGSSNTRRRDRRRSYRPERVRTDGDVLDLPALDDNQGEQREAGSGHGTPERDRRVPLAHGDVPQHGPGLVRAAAAAPLDPRSALFRARPGSAPSPHTAALLFD